MYNKIIFYNDGHLGDTFLNKPFVKEIVKKIPAKTYAFANNKYPAEYVLDIVDEYIDINVVRDYASPYKKFTAADDTLYINTWMPYCFTKEELALNKPKSNDGICYNFDVYYSCLTQVMKEIDSSFDISHMLKSKEDYVLEDYTKNINIPDVKELYRKKVLIFNQPAFSGQSDNFDHTQYIETIANLHSDVLFYISSTFNTNLSNIISLQNFVTSPDLLQIAAFSLSCDIICGPGNATTISTWTKSNINNDKKIYITINRNDPGEAMLFQNQKCTTYVVKSTPSLYNYLHTCLVRGKV
jgi:hypothetical protein